MKRDFKLVSKTLILLILTLSLFTSNISYAIGTREINNRGLVFNTGIHSDNIRLLKDFFRARGDKNVPWGYGYDGQTKELVRKFQREKGIKADGIAGPATIAKINEEIRTSPYKIGLRIPKVNRSGNLIIINKSSNTLYHMQNGRVSKVYPVATGKTSNLTPNGKHKLIVKLINPAWGGAGISKPIPGGAANNPLGPRWLGISYGGGGKYGMHGNSNPSSIGKYASLGCVRMKNPDVKDLYNRVPLGTPVWIGDEELLIRYGVVFEHNYGKTPVGNKNNEEERKVSNVKMDFNGVPLELKDKIYNVKDMNYVPIREILEKTGAEVLWEGTERKVIGYRGDNTINYVIGESKYLVNGVEKHMPKGHKAFITNDKTYVPLRDVLEGIGFTVDWDGENNTIIIRG